MNSKTSKTRKTRNPIRRYLARHIVLASAVVLLCAFYLLRELRPVADFVTTYIAQPWHRAAGTAFGLLPFSIAEVLCVLVVVGALAYLAFTIFKVIREPEKLQRAYAGLITLIAGALTCYLLICWLWGFGYYSYTFTELSGIETEELSVEELKATTIYFAKAANTAADAVSRDEQGVYTCEDQDIFREAPALYAPLHGEFAFLQGPEIQPKPLLFSYFMSHMNFTGVFFPLTGEANINVHAPDCYLPSTVAHELAHQRGVTREQDANFTAVLVCMESADADFVYSGALLAYTHLSNSLRQASPEDWEEVYSLLGDNMKRDLRANNEYWDAFQTPAAEISESAYTEFLHNQGQELGMRSYGACVDLLVAYYGDRARGR
jgi:hypothetical protein